MSLVKSNIPVISTQLTLTNVAEWRENISKIGNAFGRIGNDIMEMSDPLPLNALPDIRQLRVVGGVPLAGRFQFGSTVLDPITQLPTVDNAGLLVLAHTDAQLDAFDRVELAYRTEVDKIAALKSKISYIINMSISPESIAILKAAGLANYAKAQSDPVIMLKLIDQTHKLTDDANMQASINNLYICKQANYSSYPTFISEYRRLSKVMHDMFIPTNTTTAEELFDNIIKSFLINNVDQTQFAFIINSIHASTTPVTLDQLMDRLMNYSKTALQTVIANASVRAKTNCAFSVTGEITGICIQCGERMKLKINAQNGFAHQLCDSCYREQKLTRTGPERKFGHGPSKNMTRSELQELEDKKKSNPKPMLQQDRTSTSTALVPKPKTMVRPKPTVIPLKSKAAVSMNIEEVDEEDCYETL
jgi:hypothetical protein